jgi:hypothetical protein
MEGDVELVASNTVDLNKIGPHGIVVSLRWHFQRQFLEDSTLVISDLCHTI